MYDNNLFNVDTTGVEAMGGYEVYPAGLYPAVMIAAAKKPTRNNDGWFIECTYQFIDGDVQGKKFTSRLNLGNANVQAVDIAKRELKSIRLALGLHDQASDLADFVNKPLVLNITVKQRKDDPAKAENNLVAIEPYTGAPARVTPVQPQQAPQQQQFQPPPQQYAPQPQPQQFQQPAPRAPQVPPPAFQPNGQTPPWMAAGR